MKKLSIVMPILIILIIGFGYYQSRISFWGFNVSKSEINELIINTKENGYIVTDSGMISDITKEVSKMKKLNKIQPNNYPPGSKEHPAKFLKIFILTKNKAAYGGSFWLDNNGIILNSNGYYWTTTKGLFDSMDKSLKGAKKI